MKVALLHDWLTGMRGGERCLEQFLQLYPQADIYTLLHVPGTTSPAIDARVVQSSFLQKMPFAQRLYRHYLPLYPLASRSFDLSGYDLVISLSHAAVKNVPIRNPSTRHISYCFTPMRYVWDQARFYFGSLTPVLSPLLTALRAWDKRGAQSVDDFVAISKFVAARIRCFYQRDAHVVYPPVETEWIMRASTPSFPFKKGEAFLMAGALVPYKRPEVVIQAFNQLKEELWIVGKGPEEERLKAMAAPNIHFLGAISDIELADRYRRCRALLFPGIEDFGMIPVECMAAGRPVIGLCAGALRESLLGIRPWESAERWEKELERGNATGVFIKPEKYDSVSSLISSVYFFIDHEQAFSPDACRARALEFSPQRFRERWEGVIRCAS